MNTFEREAVIVLAAGRGRRMGAPKALMPVRGRPWWLIQRERLAAVGVPQQWVVSREVAAAMRTADLSSDQPERMIQVESECPMFASVAAGISAMSALPPEAVFVLPVDVPAPAPGVWHALRAIVDRPAAPSYSGRSGHPLRLPWRFIADRILPNIDDPQWTHEARLDRLIQQDRVGVPVHDPSVATNLNTPGALAAWLRSTDG